MKIKIKQAKKIISETKQETCVFGGVFDLIHQGHIDFLGKIKKGQVNFYICPSDNFIKKRKGATRPILNQKQRASILDNMKQVDYVILSKDLMTPTDNSLVNYVLYLKPKYFLIGDDSKERLKIFFDQIKKNGTTIIIQNIKKVNSTTDIINKIKNLK